MQFKRELVAVEYPRGRGAVLSAEMRRRQVSRVYIPKDVVPRFRELESILKNYQCLVEPMSMDADEIDVCWRPSVKLIGADGEDCPQRGSLEALRLESFEYLYGKMPVCY